MGNLGLIERGTTNGHEYARTVKTFVFIGVHSWFSSLRTTGNRTARQFDNARILTPHFHYEVAGVHVLAFDAALVHPVFAN